MLYPRAHTQRAGLYCAWNSEDDLFLADFGQQILISNQVREKRPRSSFQQKYNLVYPSPRVNKKNERKEKVCEQERTGLRSHMRDEDRGRAQFRRVYSCRPFFQGQVTAKTNYETTGRGLCNFSPLYIPAMLLLLLQVPLTYSFPFLFRSVSFLFLYASSLERCWERFPNLRKTARNNRVWAHRVYSLNSLIIYLSSADVARARERANYDARSRNEWAVCLSPLWQWHLNSFRRSKCISISTRGTEAAVIIMTFVRRLVYILLRCAGMVRLFPQRSLQDLYTSQWS